MYWSPFQLPQWSSSVATGVLQPRSFKRTSVATSLLDTPVTSDMMFFTKIGFKECQWHSLAEPLVQGAVHLSCWNERPCACNPLPCHYQVKCNPRRSSINCWWLAFPWAILKELHELHLKENMQVSMQGLKRSWQPAQRSCPTCFKLANPQEKKSCCPWKTGVALQLPLDLLQACWQQDERYFLGKKASLQKDHGAS